MGHAVCLNHGFYTWTNVIILVGLTEESVFRGFLFQKLESIFNNFWIASVLSSVLFAIMHIPYTERCGYTLYHHLYQGIAAFVFVIIFKKTNSLWSVSYIHSLNNLLAVIFGH